MNPVKRDRAWPFFLSPCHVANACLAPHRCVPPYRCLMVLGLLLLAHEGVGQLNPCLPHVRRHSASAQPLISNPLALTPENSIQLLPPDSSSIVPLHPVTPRMTMPPRPPAIQQALTKTQNPGSQACLNTCQQLVLACAHAVLAR